MVQRNVPDKLGIQDNRVQSETRLANLKPSSLQCQDIKNKGVDLKKKMKKSGSVKRMEFENHRSTKLPNYMKSTSSSMARKEQSQVSTRSPPTSRVSSDLHGKKSNYPSKHSADSRDKVAKTLVRTASLKMKRALIKTRALVKKCPKVVLCEDSYIARATCCSTLKDYKLPDYLVLNPGGTESGGTSVIKVCPYMYCSLNGYLHDPLPPLKSFMSAKRLMLKNQRNLKLGCLSPRRARSAGDDRKSDEKLVNNGDLGIPTVRPLTLEEPSEFFVEIYSAGEKNTSSTDFMSMVHGIDEIIAQDREDVEETISDSVNFHGTLDEDRGETDSIDMYHLDAKLPEEISLPLFQEETKLGNLSIWNDIATESMPSIQQCEQDSESSDTDRETGRYSALYLDFDYESPSKEEKGNDLDGFKHEYEIIHDRFIKESHNCIVSLFDANDMSQYTYCEDSLNSDSVSSKDDCRSEVSFHCLDGLNSMKTSAAIEFPKEEAEAIYENRDLPFEGNKTPEKIAQVGAKEAPSNLMIEEEISFGCLNFECLPNEDAIAVTGNGEADLLKDVVQERVTSVDKAIGDTIIDVDVMVQTSSDEGIGIPVEENLESLSTTEAEAVIVHQTKEDSSESPTKPDQAAAPDKVGRGILKNNLFLQDQFTGERIAIAIAKCKRSIEESDEEGQFNPREPNFLPLEPKPEAEKVDLRHQELDEKTNAEEWMVDYALRQTVTKLSPSRKKKVELLVEAFEKVMPKTKFELNQSHSSAFDHSRPVEACN
ncbi:uncharacterized protein LOC142505165 [Primulina tabacum]|uniref:uncharacterized protein LOC142505165 n=1 Tax=Primulina tabacum TaxID=48773 RepID=UPI003F5A73EC